MIARIDCLDQVIADEPDHQQSGHDVHGGVVGLRLRHTMRDVVFADVVHQHRTEDARRRPCGKQQAMDGADIADAEHVLQIGRHRGEPSAVHADDDQEGADESDHAADRAGIGHGAVQEEAEHHEHEVGVAAADIIGNRRPAEPSAHVEQAHEADEACRRDRRDMAGEHFLAHGGSLAEHADAGGHVQAEHPPYQPELRRLQRVVNEDVVPGDQFRRSRRRDVARRFPARRRHAHDDRTDHHEYEIDDAEHDERLGNADMRRGRELTHQPHRQWRGDEGAAAEAHDGHARRHARTVGEPFNQRRNRRDVADTERDAAEHAVAEINEPERMSINAHRRDQKSAGPAQRGGEHRLARTAFLDPAAKHRRRNAEEENRKRENPPQLGELPIAWRRLRNADQFCHRQVEHAKRVCLPDT